MRTTPSKLVLAVVLLAWVGTGPAAGAAAPPACPATTPAPAVTTGAAANVTRSGATLDGAVATNGCAAQYAFDYGTTSAYGRTTAPKTAAASRSPAVVTVAVSGLAPSTTYHYRLTATNSAGSPAGADRTFTTAPECAGAPVVATLTATAISGAGATVHARVDPRGCATNYAFQYGTTTAYSASTPVASAGLGSVAVAEAAAIGGLAANTQYHYRVLATNAAGTTYGADHTFRTSISCDAGSGALPVVSPGRVSSVTENAATVSGTVDPNGCAGSYRVEYGTSTGYGKVTGVKSLAAQQKATNVSIRLIGLSPDTAYHARLVATTPVGTSRGSDAAFSTPGVCRRGAGPLAGADTVAPAAVGNTTATLRGALNDRGCAASYRFEYGTTTLYGSETAPQRVGASALVVPVQAPISGLAPHTTYHAALLVATIAGTSHGPDIAFTTGGSSSIVVGSAPLTVTRGFTTDVLLTCTGGTAPCGGFVKLFRHHRLIGKSGFYRAAGAAGVTEVHLNGRGRRLVRHHRSVRIEVAARVGSQVFRRFTELVRQR
jgi:hypothetical protein